MTIQLEGTLEITAATCTNTCFGTQPGDSFPDVFALFGPPLGEVNGTFSFVYDTSFNVISINGNPILNTIHAKLDFGSGLLTSFTPGAFLFEADGPPTIWGLIPHEEVPFCLPAVPEPATWALFAFGIAFIALTRRRKV